MNILHVNLAMGYTEGLNYQENVLSKLHAQEGHNVTVLTTPYCFNEGVWGPCRTSFDYINEYGVHVVRLDFKYKLPYKLNKQIGRFSGIMSKLESIAPDVICVHNIQFRDLKVITDYKKDHPDVKLFIDNHADESNSARTWFSRNVFYKLWWRPVARYSEPYTDKFYGVTPSRVDFLTDVYGIEKDRCDLLCMGADDEAVSEALKPEVRKGFREKNHIEDDDFLVMTGGKIDAFKTQTLMLMEAVRDIDNPKLKLIIFGSVDDEYKARVESLCDGYRIRHIGWARGNESYDFLAAADLAVYPGRHSVYWEQTAGLGIPMICKYWKGTTHVDVGGNVIFLMEDSKELIQKEIERLLAEPDRYKKMKEAATKRGMEVFSYKRIAKIAIGENA